MTKERLRALDSASLKKMKEGAVFLSQLPQRQYQEDKARLFLKCTALLVTV